MDFLVIMLAVLGIILLVCLIVLIVRLNFTLSKIDNLLNDIEKKMTTVNRAFEVADKISDSVSLVGDRMIEILASIIAKLFKNRKKKVNLEEEEEF